MSKDFKNISGSLRQEIHPNPLDIQVYVEVIDTFLRTKTELTDAEIHAVRDAVISQSKERWLNLNENRNSLRISGEKEHMPQLDYFLRTASDEPGTSHFAPLFMIYPELVQLLPTLCR
jgi:hypothetical protein